jgi:hypothetical protein
MMQAAHILPNVLFYHTDQRDNKVSSIADAEVDEPSFKPLGLRFRYLFYINTAIRWIGRFWNLYTRRRIRPISFHFYFVSLAAGRKHGVATMQEILP